MQGVQVEEKEMVKEQEVVGEKEQEKGIKKNNK